MFNHGRDPNLSRKYDRRAKAGALVSSIPGILGVSVVAEGFMAPPVGAAIETTANYEGLSPKAMVTSVNNNLLKLQQEVKRAHGVKEVPSPATESKVYYVTVPSAAHPGHHDMFGINTSKSGGLPILESVIINAESKQKTTYLITHGDPDQKKSDNPNIITLYIDKGTQHAGYRIGEHKSSLPAYTEYLGDPSGVAGQFNHFFQMASNILGIKSK